MPSPFSLIPPTAFIASNELAFAVFDLHPVSPGHTLIIPRREVPAWFDASREEQSAILDLLDVMKNRLDQGTPCPAGYNAGDSASSSGGGCSPAK